MQKVDFSPSLLLTSGMLQTLLAGQRQAKAKVEANQHEVALPDGDRLHFYTSGPQSARGVMLVPGLGQSYNSSQLKILARQLAALGYFVGRFNHRGVGRSRAIARGIYHAGRTEDIAAAMSAMTKINPDLRSLTIIALSLGANMVVRHLGESQAATIGKVQLKGVVAVSPVFDLKASTTRLAQGPIRLFDRSFLKYIKAYIAQRHKNWPDLGTVADKNWRNLRDIDHSYVAPNAGYRDADGYYAGASAKNVISTVAVPLVIVTAADDPIQCEDFSQYRNAKLLRTADGGHLGFLSSFKDLKAKQTWLERTVIGELEQLQG